MCTQTKLFILLQALLDGPCTGVSRQARRFTELHLTGLVTKITRGASERSVRIAWTNDKISEKWSTTSWARRIEKRVKVNIIYVQHWPFINMML